MWRFDEGTRNPMLKGKLNPPLVPKQVSWMASNISCAKSEPLGCDALGTQRHVPGQSPKGSLVHEPTSSIRRLSDFAEVGESFLSVAPVAGFLVASPFTPISGFAYKPPEWGSSIWRTPHSSWLELGTMQKNDVCLPG